jgi:hypothetical protein
MTLASAEHYEAKRGWGLNEMLPTLQSSGQRESPWITDILLDM